MPKATLEIGRGRDYKIIMSKLTAKMPESAPESGKIVCDSSTGRLVEVRGYGALKGQLDIVKGVDLTKPIYDQIKKKSPRRTSKHV